MTTDTYAGDLTPQESWNVLVTENNSFLIDVRTDAEYSFVGVTDLSSLNKKTIYVNWLFFPSSDLNPEFAAELESKNFDKDQPLLFLCSLYIVLQVCYLVVVTITNLKGVILETHELSSLCNSYFYI